MDYSRQQREHTPIHINRTAVERAKSVKFLKWSLHADSVVMKAQQYIRLGSYDPHELLQMQHREHSVRMYHRLVLHLPRTQLQGSSEGGAVSPKHY